VLVSRCCALPGFGRQLRVSCPSPEDIMQPTGVEDVERGGQDLGEKPPRCHNHLGTVPKVQRVHHCNGLVVWALL